MMIIIIAVIIIIIDADAAHRVPVAVVAQLVTCQGVVVESKQQLDTWT